MIMSSCNPCWQLLSSEFQAKGNLDNGEEIF